jgi:hypothetical protein
MGGGYAYALSSARPRTESRRIESEGELMSDLTRDSLKAADARERINCRLALCAPELFAHVKDYAHEIRERWGEHDVIYRRVKALIDHIEGQ